MVMVGHHVALYCESWILEHMERASSKAESTPDQQIICALGSDCVFCAYISELNGIKSFIEDMGSLLHEFCLERWCRRFLPDYPDKKCQKSHGPLSLLNAIISVSTNGEYLQ